MLKMIVLSMMAVAVSASADTYRPTKGQIELKHPNRCASHVAIKRIADLVDKNLRVTVGHGQMTVFTEWDDDDGHHKRTTAADRLGDASGTLGYFDIQADGGGTITVIVNVSAIGRCTEVKTCATWESTIRISAIQRYLGSECYEDWFGTAEKI